MKIPDIKPIEGPERLVHLFELQTAMQKFNHNKRPDIVDPYSNNVHDRIMMAIYQWNATSVEYMEMSERLEEIDLDKLPDDKVTEELVDMLHFILGQLLYLGFNGSHSFTLTELYSFSHKKTIDENWSELTFGWGQLMETLPYKIWKSYPTDEMRLVHSPLQTSNANQMLKSFVGLCKILKVDENMLYLGYINKNIENFKRQMPGGKYEN